MTVLKISHNRKNMELLNLLLDRMVRENLEEDKIEQLIDIVDEAPIVPKYDPEDFDPVQIDERTEQRKVSEMEEIISHPAVGAVQIGGSYDVNSRKVGKTLELLSQAEENTGQEIFTMLEPGSPTDLQDEDGQFDLDVLTEPDAINKSYVWNTTDSEWKDGKHSEAQKLLNNLTRDKGEMALYEKVRSSLSSKVPKFLQKIVDPDKQAASYIDHIDNPVSYIRRDFDNRIISETYLVVNPDAAVAEKTGADEWLETATSDDLIEEGAAMAADRIQDGYQGILYIEASGELGPEEVVGSVEQRLPVDEDSYNMLVAYGGGIEDGEGAKTYLDAGADLVFVGNSIQENGAEALPSPEKFR